MAINLLNAFSTRDFKEAGKKSSELIELTFTFNQTSGATFARAIFEDGSTLVKQVFEETSNGTVMQFPKICTVAERTRIIKDLYKEYTQQDIAAILDISQATVSSAIHIVNRKEN